MIGLVATRVALGALWLLVAPDAAALERTRLSACDASGVATRSVGRAAPLRLVLNVPAYRLDVFERDALIMSLVVAVGSPRYPTPIGEYGIDFVEWNPWWRPPPSPWARGERPARPGWSNPVGRVKLHVTGLVFIHGSPLVQSLGSAASHACVRLANDDAMRLARLVHRHVSPPDIAPLLDSLEADTSATRRILIHTPVPISIRYDLAELADGNLVVHPDIYRLAGRRVPTVRGSVMALLAHAGRDTATVRADVLIRVLREGRTRRVAIALDSLAALRIQGRGAPDGD